MFPTHSWLFDVMVMNPDWESVGSEFKYMDFCFRKERPCLISLILNLIIVNKLNWTSFKISALK